MGSTRNDGMPTPDPDGYRMLQALAWLATPFVEVFGSAAASGTQRTPEERAGWSPTWPECCLITAVAALIFYAAVIASRRHGGRAAALAERRRFSSEVRAEAAREQSRARYFGDRRLPFAAMVSPALWTLPVIIAGIQDLPPDPVTGQAEMSVGNMVAGMVLAVMVILLWSLTGRALTALGVAVWLTWAGWTMDGKVTAGAHDGFAGITIVLVAVVLAVVPRRRALSRT